MRFIFHSIAVALLALVLVCSVKGQPRIRIDTEEIDEPDLFPDELKDYTVNVSNVGNADLDFNIVVSYSRGGNWVIIEPLQGHIAPNEDLNIDVLLTPYWESMDEGNYMALIHFLNNDPDDSDAVVRYLLSTVEHPTGVPIQQGWNMVSCYYLLDDDSIVNVFQEVQDAVMIVKDDQGRFYIPSQNFNNIPFWDFRQGYQVKATQEANLIFWRGHPAPQDTTIPLREGWNMVAYFPDSALEAPDAFSNLADNLVMAKDGEGNFYIPTLNYNNMPPLHRCAGYLVKVSREAEFIWGQ